MNTQHKHKTIFHETKVECKEENHHFVKNNALREEIEKKAYELYESRGCQADRDLENWLEAERLINAGCAVSH